MKITITKRIKSKSMSKIRICFASLPLSQRSSLNLNPPWNCRRSPLSVNRGLIGSSPRLLDQLLEYHQKGGVPTAWLLAFGRPVCRGRCLSFLRSLSHSLPEILL